MMSIEASGREPGSFRDPESRIFYDGGEVYRALSREALADFEALQRSGLLDDARIVGTQRADAAAAPGDPLATHGPGGLRPERRPVVSYPHQGTFSMPKSAARPPLE